MSRKGVNLYQFTLGTKPFYMKQVEYNANHEIAMLNRVQNHPNIVKLHFSNFDSRFFYIVTEACAMDLQMRCVQRLQKNFLPDEVSVLADTKQIVTALTHLHSMGILHNDIKVENILVKTDGSLVLCDFEAATYWNGDLTTERRGTYLYLPPEAIANNHLFNPMLAEMWALGTVIYAITHNSTPFPGSQPFEVYMSMKKKPVCRLSTNFQALVYGLLSSSKNRWLMPQVRKHLAN